MPAMALTDHGNLYGAVDFYTACKGVGVKPIIGCEMYVAPKSRFDKVRTPGQRVAHHLILLAKDATGYRNLCKLSSLAFTEGFYYHPRIDKELLKNHSEGLLCISACLSGEVATVAAEDGDLEATVGWYRDLFGDDFYLELQRHQMTQEAIEADGMLEEGWLQQRYESFVERQERVNQRLIALGLPMVATNDIHYLDREEWRAHEILLNIQSGEPCEIWERDSLGNPKMRVPNPKRRTYASHELYFKTPEQMAELFSDVPQALEATLEVADKCNFDFDFKARHYPVYEPPNGEGQDAYLRRLCEERISKRYSSEALAHVERIFPGRDPLEVVRERLEHELSVIIPKGMCDYLLIVWDFIHWAKERGIPVGPGRGSGAGSIVLYLIGVTDIEPLRFGLFFERFINPERFSYPDIDVDICMERRGDVIDYTVDTYGKGNVAQIITFGTMKAKMAIRDVGRVLNVPLAKVDSIAKLVPEELGITIERALETDPDLYRVYKEDEEATRLIDLAKQLEGSVRSTGIHAAGVIIAGAPLTEHIPVCTAKDSDMVATQYAMKPVEKVGMLKMDFLGLKTLTSIQKAISALKKQGIEIDPLALPLDDPTTFGLLQSGKTAGVFQMESLGMQELAHQLRPDAFEEIMAIIALYRPGPMDMIPTYVARKHGREPIEYDHPLMRDILSETYGIMVYQEQVMQIAQTLAGYSLGEGDVLRKAMGKKIAEEMAAQRDKFLQGAVANGIDEPTAIEIFDKIDKFASYGFNKSHAAAYGLLTYITAFLKANHPTVWMAALMTADRGDLTKVARWIRECQTMGIAILPPDINEASDAFEATPAGIRFAMTAIKGVGEGVVESILDERTSEPFSSLYDFVQRIDHKRVGKKVIEALTDAGCFDYTGWSRDQLRESVQPMYEVAARDKKDEATGVMSLFSLIEEEKEPFSEPPSINEPTPAAQVLMRERELLGFFLTGHPMDSHRDLLQRLSCIPLSEVQGFTDPTVIRTAFIIETLKTRIANKSQRKFAILTVGDGMESFELPIWADIYEERGHLLVENQLYYAVLQIEMRDGAQRISCRWLELLSRVTPDSIAQCDAAYDRAKMMMNRAQMRPKKKEEKPVEKKSLKLKLDMKKLHLSHILELKRLFRASPGDSPVEIEMRDGERLSIDAPWGVEIKDTLLRELKEVASLVSIE
jgi:DNA polymerase III subunit alpha